MCEDPKQADGAEDIQKEMENEENTITDFSPEPTGERPTKCSEGNETDAKKHEAEVSKLTSSEGYFSLSQIDRWNVSLNLSLVYMEYCLKKK